MPTYRKLPLGKRILLDIRKNKYKYLMILPIVIYFIIFHYKPMYGVIIAFKRFKPTVGIWKSDWVGLKYFISFFKDPYFFRLLKNTLSISFLELLFGFPAPIILALLLNEIKALRFKKLVQTISYMPHFISTVVICGMITTFCNTNGLFNDIIAAFGGARENLLGKSELFYPIYVLSGIWQGVGWGSILYLAALSGIDQEQYEAAKIDGAGRIQQMFYITLPGLAPTIVMMLILRVGSLMSVGYEKIILLYNTSTYDVADIISSYVYRRGIIEGNFSYGAAVGLFNSLINVILIVFANSVSKKMGQSGIY